MLNPYMLQKDLMSKLKFIEDGTQTFKVNMAKETLQLYTEELNSALKKEMEQCTFILSIAPKDYSCCHCDKIFNDGRRLGGHISRAHKLIKVKKEQNCSDEEEPTLKDKCVKKKKKLKKEEKDFKYRLRPRKIQAEKEKREQIYYQDSSDR